MNPSSRTNVPFCDGVGCISPVDTWPLHHVHRHGVRTSLCSSCLLLSHRSYYCCYCFMIIPGSLPCFSYGDDDPNVAAPAPTAACQVCREAVAHLACLHYPGCRSFICPPCSAAAEGIPFTYGPPRGVPLDERGAKVLFLGARLAMTLLRQSADMARAVADRMARIAADAQRRASRAVAVAMGYVDTEELPSRNDNVLPVMALPVPVPPPPRPENRLDLGESCGTSVNAPRVPQPRRAMMPPPPAQRQRSSRARPRPAQQRRNATSAPAQQRRNATPPPPQQQLHATPPPAQQQQQLHAMPPLAALTIDGARGITQTQLARAATEAARYSGSIPPTRTLPLFGALEAATASSSVASTSRAPPPTLPLFPARASSRRAAPRTLQLFQDKVPDDEEM